VYRFKFFFLDAENESENDSQNEQNSLELVKDVFTEIINSVGIPEINAEDNSSNESGNY